MRVGWYVHHHGRGHLHRFLAVRPHLGDATALSSLARPPEVPSSGWVALPLDTPIAPAQRAGLTAGGRLHWAPLGPGGYRARMAAISRWLEHARPDVLVVDVSVEVALLARLLGVPVVWIAQRGVREDPAHRLAYDVASRIIAPWTPSLQGEAAGGPPPQRTVHVGALSRFDGRPAAAPAGDGPPRVLVLLGAGGHRVGAEAIEAAAAATPDWRWDVAGLAGPPSAATVTFHGPDAEVWPLLGACHVAVATASTNAVSEVAAARRPLICLPQERPFGEQAEQARALAAAGLAEAVADWPASAAWPGLLARARRRDPATWAVLHDGHGAERLAAALEVA